MIRDTIIEDSFEIPGRELGSWSQMYIDDLTVGEVHALERSKRHLTQHKEVKTIHAYHCEESFNVIKTNADEIGMVINALKTQLICISDDRNSNTSSYINTDNKRINSVYELKVLGFIFENRPSVGAHVKHCCDKFNRAVWALNHLKLAKINTNVLVDVYKIMLRPLLEYCSPVYHYMLTLQMEETLERQQKRALRIIFGFSEKYEDLLEKTGLETLKQRRISACANFTKKLLDSERFTELFPRNNTRDRHDINLRNSNAFIEEFARSNRLYNSPLYSMRRYLNKEF